MHVAGYVPLGGVSPMHLDALSNAPAAEALFYEATHELIKRINITLHRNSTAEQNATMYLDPWWNAGQYGLGWVYFCVLLLVVSSMVHGYRVWTDKIRKGLHKEVIYRQQEATRRLFQPRPYGLSASEALELETPQSSTSALAFFPPPPHQKGSASSSYVQPVEYSESSLSLPIFHKIAARIRYWTYRPTPTFWFSSTMLSFAPFHMLLLIGAATIFVVLFTFIPRPYFYPHANDGGPPLAVRAGMLAVAMIPWIVALSMKVNLVSVMTGIGHERLSVLHRWGGYICLGLGLVHMIPYYVQPVWQDNALNDIYYPQNYFWQTSYPYGTGLAAFVPLAFLCLHSLPILRSKMYEVFVVLHIPASLAFLAMLFWHTQNYLGSWGYLWATVGIWATAIATRVFFLNWAAFWRKSWLHGEAASVTVLPENAVKVTIPTQIRWKAGQFVYLRIPELSWLENHPFTVAALCDDKLPSMYGREYRDMILVFRPFAGFTRKLLNASLKNGPQHVYKAYVDGPHGGIQRDLVSFDTVVFVAGGSGITAVISHLLLLVHKMREQSAVTKKVYVIWAMKRPEAAEWFREELRICRHFAPENSVNCEFYITGAKRYSPTFRGAPAQSASTELIEQRTSVADLSERVDTAFAGIASKRNSALVREAAEGDAEKAITYGQEVEDKVQPLPQAHMPSQVHSIATRRPKANLKLHIPQATGPAPQKVLTPSPTQTKEFQFGFEPNTGEHDDSKDAKSGGPFSSASTFVGSPPTASRQNSFHNPATYFSPASTQATNSPPASTTTLQRKFVSPIFYANEPDIQPTPYFPPPPTGTHITAAPNTSGVPPQAQLRPMNPASSSYPASNTAGWSTEYGRPNISNLIRGYESNFGKRTAIFVCGPESMRRDVQSCAARMQKRVWEGKVDEVFLRVESYRL